MVRKRIPESVRLELWIKSGGRCQFKGCNEPLWRNGLTLSKRNFGDFAHIIAASEKGPRGNATSYFHQQDISNLMLLCKRCHKEIDSDTVRYTPDLLSQWKKEHEERIEIVTGIAENMKSLIVTYKTNVGQHTPTFDFNYLANYLIPHYYPFRDTSIDLGISDNPFKDDKEPFWETEINVLETNFKDRLETVLRNNTVDHISLFAFAPIPLLIKLGTLLNDIHNIEVHQPVREPKTWSLSDEDTTIEYKIIEPNEKHSIVALNISLSADINNSRIENVLGKECSIYTLTIDNPFNDFLKTKKELKEFSKTTRELLNQIKKEYDNKTVLHIFPAMPIATAIELGRVWMPKADMPLLIFDESKVKGGFYETIKIQ